MVVMAVVLIGGRWFAQAARQSFGSGLEAIANSLDVKVDSTPWQVDWLRQVVAAKDVSVSTREGKRLLDAPLVEVDFRIWKLSDGWRSAIWQVYVHRPVVRAADASSEWISNHFAEATGSKAAFVLGRFYADVVTVEFDDGSRWDNGVLELKSLAIDQTADAGTIGGDFAMQLHARVVERSGSRKVSVWRRYDCPAREGEINSPANARSKASEVLCLTQSAQDSHDSVIRD